MPAKRDGRVNDGARIRFGERFVLPQRDVLILDGQARGVADFPIVMRQVRPRLFDRREPAAAAAVECLERMTQISKRLIRDQALLRPVAMRPGVADAVELRSGVASTNQEIHVPVRPETHGGDVQRRAVEELFLGPGVA